MANVKGRGVTVAIAATYSSPIVVTAVTKASPGVATTAGTAPANDIVGYWSGVTGMAQLEYQATRTKNRTATTWELQGLNTTNYATFTAGNFTPVATWATLSEATSYSIGGGASEKLDVTTLLDIVRKEELGLLPVESVTMSVIAQDTPSAAMQLLDAAVQTQTGVVVRITLGNGAVRVFYAEPGTPGEDVQQGAVGTGSLDMAVKGFVMKLAA
jgi:hypothetical protein